MTSLFEATGQDNDLSCLNRAYRAIYVEQEDGKILVAQVIEVNKHEY
jgi:hypothetical protein